jgi:Caspase domain
MRSFLRSIAFLCVCAAVPLSAAGQPRSTNLPDGVVRYDRSSTAAPGFFQVVREGLGYVFKSTPFDRSVAFLVGVGKYHHLNPQLAYIDNDINQMRDFLLTEAGFDTVFVALNDVANANLVDNYMLTILPKELSSRDRLLFYFSGHGTDFGGYGYLQFGGANDEYDRSQYLDVRQAQYWSSVLPAKHVLYLIDACSAGLGVLGKQAATSRRTDAQAQAELLSILSGTGSRWLVTAGFGSEMRAPRHRDHLFHAIVITHSTPS